MSFLFKIYPYVLLLGIEGSLLSCLSLRVFGST